jgi:hypothetical protein
MANVFDSGLVVSTISQQVQTVLANRLAPLRLFTSDFSNEVKKAKDTIQVPIVSATAATSVNPTNFEPGSSVTIGKATVTLDHVAQFFGIDQADLALGHRLENLIKINVDALADKLWSLAITPITTVNFGAATVTTTTITPGSGHLASLWSAISKSTNKGLVVTPAIYSALIPTNADFLPLQNGAYGFDQGVFYANSFTGAVSGLDGFACSREAVCVASAQADDRPCGFLAVPDQRSSRDPRSVGPLGLLERLGFDQQSSGQRLHRVDVRCGPRPHQQHDGARHLGSCVHLPAD